MKVSIQFKILARILFLSFVFTDLVSGSKKNKKKGKKRGTVHLLSGSSSDSSNGVPEAGGDCIIRKHFQTITELRPPTSSDDIFDIRVPGGFLSQDAKNTACNHCVNNARTLSSLFNIFIAFHSEHYKPFFDFLLYTSSQLDDDKAKAKVMVICADASEWYLPTRRGGNNSEIIFVRMQRDKKALDISKSAELSFSIFVDDIETFNNLESKNLSFFYINVECLRVVTNFSICV